jgi:hypothetical protein
MAGIDTLIARRLAGKNMTPAEERKARDTERLAWAQRMASQRPSGRYGGAAARAQLAKEEQDRQMRELRQSVTSGTAESEGYIKTGRYAKGGAKPDTTRTRR